MNNMNPKVDEFIRNAKKWQDEYKKLRSIVLDCELIEELKWGVPCYTNQGRNIVLIHGFKEYCAILFVNGALLKDPHKILIQQTGNVQAARQARFTNVQQIIELESILNAYVNEAIDADNAGLKIDFKKTAEFNTPDELKAKFAEMPDLKTAFESLTPGRQRAYLLFFAAPKQTQTRTARIEKYTQVILDGKGLND